MIGLSEAATGGFLFSQYLQEIPVLESLFKNAAGLLQFYSKETPIRVIFNEYCQIFKTTCFVKRPRRAAFLLFQWLTVTWA